MSPRLEEFLNQQLMSVAQLPEHAPPDLAEQVMRNVQAVRDLADFVAGKTWPNVTLAKAVSLLIADRISGMQYQKEAVDYIDAMLGEFHGAFKLLVSMHSDQLSAAMPPEAPRIIGADGKPLMGTVKPS